MTVSETSIEAYYAIQKLQAPLCIKVRNYIEANPDSTNEEIAHGLRMKIQSITPRVKELKTNGIIWNSGRKNTDSGRPAYTYRPATCPRCMSTHLSAEKHDKVNFDYYCWNCGRSFRAHVGEKFNEPVEVFA